MADTPRPGFGLVRLKVETLPPGIYVVSTHPEAQINPSLRMAHVELRFPTASGGEDFPTSMKRKLARLAAFENLLIEPASG